MKSIAGVALAAVMACGWAGGAEAAPINRVFITLNGFAYDTTVFELYIGNRSIPGPDPLSASLVSLSKTKSPAINAGFASSAQLSSPSLPYGSGGYGSSYIAEVASNDQAKGLYVVSYNIYGSNNSLNYPYVSEVYNEVDIQGSFYTDSLITLDKSFHLGASEITNREGNFSGYMTYFNGSDHFINEEYGSFSLNNLSVAVSEVPIPSSAPLFGAALLGLGALGFGMKRRGLAKTA